MCTKGSTFWLKPHHSLSLIHGINPVAIWFVEVDPLLRKFHWSRNGSRIEQRAIAKGSRRELNLSSHQCHISRHFFLSAISQQ